MRSLSSSLLLSAALAVCVSGCAHGGGHVGPIGASTALDSAALDAAVEAYYTATTVERLRTAVERALAVGPGTASAHEIAADLARMDEDLAGQVDHLLIALADTGSDATELHLNWLGWLELTTPERRRAMTRLRQLQRAHPVPAVRAAAAATLSRFLAQEADYSGAAELSPPGLQMAFIGTWDNDQGKGFDTVRPPEEGVDLSARYDGTVVEVGWRDALPRTHRGVYDLDSLLSPRSWATAYATAVVVAPDAQGDYELRMGTTSPFKVWVNGQLIASVEERRAEMVFDGFVCPLSLRPGPNRLLIKLAHRKGSWLFRPRLTAVGGAEVPLQLGDPGQSVAPSSGPAPLVRDGMAFVTSRVANLRGSPARKAIFASAWAAHLGLPVEAIKLAQRALATHPDAIVATYLLAGIHWDHQERGQAADLLGRLDRAFGEALPFVRGQQARFWIQQDRNDQARDHLMALRDAYPERAHVWRRVATYFNDEGWHQERCEALKRANGLRPEWPDGMKALGVCYGAMDRHAEAISLWNEGLDELPGSFGLLKRLRDAHQRAGRLGEALLYAERIVQGWPASYAAWVHLGDLHRRLRASDASQEAYERAVALDPDAAWAHKRLGALAREDGDLARALVHWKDALERNPDDDKLARYVSFQEAGPDEPWLVDVPDQATIDDAIATGRAQTPPDGADAISLIDHRVTRLYADGSRSGVVTQVVQAVNEQGRDRVTSMRLGEPGRIQVLLAYAANPDGTRVEATRPRDGKVRFRSLQDGSAIVLQYRYDSGSQPFLALHMAEMWAFHTPVWGSTWSEWALWLDRDEVVHEQGLGTPERTEVIKDGLKRITWTMRDVPPLVPEPRAPSHLEVVNHVMVSTVPDWQTFMRWEAALLAGAFRADPAIEALAATLVSADDSPMSRVLKIHDYVMNEIRYEQDYENTIAGVKPHAAPVVLERRYGDCKDKAVLFITLARLVGVDVHFAILKTRPKGPVYRDVPYQQFDHAIVYVPAQDGIPEGRFYDPTADSLDLDVLRQDDAGATALVFDPVKQVHAWVPIPFQEAGAHHTVFDLHYTLRADGSADGVLTLTGRGTMGSRLRQSARNTAKFNKWIAGLVGLLTPGATVTGVTPVEVSDLRSPARIEARFVAPGITKREGKTARVSLPWPRLYQVTPNYKLPERKYDLLLGVPQILDLNVRYTLPRGARVISELTSETIDAPCSRFVRTVSGGRNEVTVTGRLSGRCERVKPDNYLAQRRFAKRIDELNSESFVLRIR